MGESRPHFKPKKFDKLAKNSKDSKAKRRFVHFENLRVTRLIVAAENDSFVPTKQFENLSLFTLGIVILKILVILFNLGTVIQKRMQKKFQTIRIFSKFSQIKKFDDFNGFYTSY